MNHSNKIEQSMAEGEDGRPLIKENIHQPNTRPTRSGVRVSQGLAGVRKAAREHKEIKFTALLHHLQGANQPQPPSTLAHGSNGQVGVIAQDIAATYTNFNVSAGVPVAPITGLSQLFAIQSLLSNKFSMDSDGAMSAGSAAIQTYTTAKNPANYTNVSPPAPVSWTANTQLWQLRAESAGAFLMTNAQNGLYLDLSGTNVVQNTCNGSTATQSWWFIPVTDSSSFVLQNSSTLQVIDAGSGGAGGQLVVSTRAGTTSQKWQLISQ